MAKSKPTGWVGWIYFASVMMMLVGGMQAIIGLVALFKDTYYVVAKDSLIAFDFTTWGWVHLVLGIVIFLAGAAVLSGSVWARTVGVFLAALSALANLAFLGAYPLWAIIAITVDMFVIYALTMHGRDASY